MKIIFAVLMVMLLAGTVLAIHDWTVYDYNIDGYSGQVARERRQYDPYSRERYFGIDYNREFVNFGSKGPTDRLIKTGAKSGFSSVFNLDTNTLSNRGRDPSKISNWDPGMLGFARLDASIDLLPYSPVEEVAAHEAILAKGTARILSTGNQYGAGLNKPYPRSQIFVQAINLPPVGESEIYQAWLLDAETEYPLSVGLMKAGAGITGAGYTSELIFEIRRLVHMFDYVMITREPFPDSDPGPGEVILFGRIDPARTRLATPTSFFKRLR